MRIGNSSSRLLRVFVLGFFLSFGSVHGFPTRALLAKPQQPHRQGGESGSTHPHHRPSSSFELRNKNDDNGDDSTSFHPRFAQSRRHLFQQALATTMPLLLANILPLPAHAGGLLQFPVGAPSTQPLKNKYHFLRAGPSELEVQGIYSTNPLFLTNRENAMDAASGEAIILQALEQIQQQELFPTIAYHSLAANGMDTGDLIARELKLGREKLLPEFTYLDQRGVGLWDSGDESLVKPAIWAMDYQEAGVEGKGGRPPANTDGTPNETLGDQFIRLRQFLSLQESRTAGEIILVIFPDGTGPALLSCMIAGIPFRDVHALEFVPGEVRFDITPESVTQLYQQRKDDPAYLAILKDGKDKLATLRSQRTIVGLKEQKAEQERLDIEAEYTQKKQADAQRELERQQQVARSKELEKLAQQQAKQEKLAQQQAKQERKEQQQQQQMAASSNSNRLGVSTSKLAQQHAKQERKEHQQVAATSNRIGASTSKATLSSTQVAAGAVVGALGLGLAAVVGMAGNSGTTEDDKKTENATAPQKETTMTTNMGEPNGDTMDCTMVKDDDETIVSTPLEMERSSASSSDTTGVDTTVGNKDDETAVSTPLETGRSSSSAPSSSSSGATTASLPAMETTPTSTSSPRANEEEDGHESLDENSVEPPAVDRHPTAIPSASVIASSTPVTNANQEDVDSDISTTTEEEEEELSYVSSDRIIEDQLNQLAAAEQAMNDALQEVAASTKQQQPPRASSTQNDDDPNNEELNRLEAAQRAMDEYLGMDDGADDWLQSLAEIREESDDDEAELVVNGDSTSQVWGDGMDFDDDSFSLPKDIL